MKIESIKFKAKRLDGKGWVCGYFYEENGNTYIIENRQKESKLNRNLTYQVDPSTGWNVGWCMKIRLAKKIMKQARHLSTASDYWYRRLRDFEYKICYGFVGKKDHRITKAISLTSKKK